MKLIQFLFINVFAFLLFALGVVVLFMPKELFYLIFKILIAVIFIVSCVNLFIEWPAKKHLIEILVLRNRNEIRLDTFKKHKETLCGKLVVMYTMNMLRKTDNYRTLSTAEWKLKKRKVFEENSVGAWRKKNKKRR